MGKSMTVPSGNGKNQVLATCNTFSTGDSTQILLYNDAQYISNSKNFEADKGLVCKQAGKYKIKYIGHGSYNKLYIYKNGSAIFNHTFQVRGPRISGELEVDLSVGDVLTIYTEPMIYRGSFAMFDVYKG